MKNWRVQYVYRTNAEGERYVTLLRMYDASQVRITFMGIELKPEDYADGDFVEIGDSALLRAAHKEIFGPGAFR